MRKNAAAAGRRAGLIYIASDTAAVMDGWLSCMGSAVPRGFSRYYIMELLGTEPRTGKEIIEHAAEKSGGHWKPSPGLIYPLLGRLLDEGMIEEDGGGRYRLTEKGKTTAADADRVEETVKKQMEVLARLGNLGRFGMMDMLERFSVAIGSGSMKGDERERYRKFLVSELERLDKN